MKRLVGLLIGLALGVALAMLIGWVLVPMEQQGIAPDSMREDYRNEYVRLTAIAYRGERDLSAAEQRLRALNAMPFTAPLVDLTESWIAAGRPSELIVPLADLARALGVETEAMAPYVGGASP